MNHSLTDHDLRSAPISIVYLGDGNTKLIKILYFLSDEQNNIILGKKIRSLGVGGYDSSRIEQSRTNSTAFSDLIQFELFQGAGRLVTARICLSKVWILK